MKKKKDTRWVRKRHGVYLNIVRFFFTPYLKLRYNFSVEKYGGELPEQALVMCNHLTTLDPVMLGMAFKKVPYFFTSDDLFTIPVISPILKHIVAPIPKSKSKSDLNAVRISLKVVKEGGSVAVFPEGNRSLSGGLWHIDISTAKLAKMMKIPLILCRLKGGYGSDPRWGRGVRRGKMSLEFARVLTPEEIANTSVDELYNIILENLEYKDYESGTEFKYKNGAEYLERALYYCPTCGRFNSLYSHKNTLSCSFCDMKAEYTPTLTFKEIGGSVPYSHVKEWYDSQKALLAERAESCEGELFSDGGVQVRLVEGRRRKLNIGVGKISASNTGVDITFKAAKKNIRLDFSSIEGATVLGKRKINFYLKDGKTVQVKGFPRFSSVKYLHLYEIHKDKEN